MVFFGGFGFSDNIKIFEPILREFGYFDANPYNVCGFSFGAQKAVQYTLESLETNARINRVLLLSPAFFNDRDLAFKNAQLRAFSKNRVLYMKTFYKNIGLCAEDKQFLQEVESLDLCTLEQCLYYEFKGEDLILLNSRGVEIVAILGSRDKIINANVANDFFSKYGIVYMINDANHLLCEV